MVSSILSILTKGNYVKISKTFPDENVEYYGKLSGKETMGDDCVTVFDVFFEKLVTVVYSDELHTDAVSYSLELSEYMTELLLEFGTESQEHIKVSLSSEDEMIGKLSEAINKILY